jgi:hypothetical protein
MGLDVHIEFWVFQKGRRAIMGNIELATDNNRTRAVT